MLVGKKDEGEEPFTVKEGDHTWALQGPRPATAGMGQGRHEEPHILPSLIDSSLLQPP